VRKISRKGIVKKLDKVVSDYVRAKDRFCVVCGSTNQLGSGHVFSRKAYNTRWDITDNGNVHCQCWSCNYRHVRDQYPYFKWYQDRFGMKKFDKLRRRFKTIKKYKTYELVELYEELLATYEDMDNSLGQS